MIQEATTLRVKQHLPALDGLRGIAAISIVVFHLQLFSYDPAHPSAFWLRHAYLAVDFFFCLSGYVIAHSYDDRRACMTPREFLLARLIRLHPMVVLGVLLGLLSYLMDPFSGGHALAPWLERQSASAPRLLTSVVAGLLMIPSPPLPNRWDLYFPLNAPCWSLMWEYLANIAFAFAFWRMASRMLLTVLLISGFGLLASAYWSGTLALGASWNQMGYALARTAFSFCMGIALRRRHAALKSPLGFAVLAAMTVGLFAMPYWRFNWLYESLVVVIAFPLIVSLGAGAERSPIWVQRLCRVLGRVSYPLYATHYALCTVFVNFYWKHVIGSTALPWVIVALTMLLVAFSYAVLLLCDEPLRAFLSRRFRAVRNFAAGPIEASYVNKAI